MIRLVLRLDAGPRHFAGVFLIQTVHRQVAAERVSTVSLKAITQP